MASAFRQAPRAVIDGSRHRTLTIHRPVGRPCGPNVRWRQTRYVQVIP
jgi:hypothetical protein